MPNRYAQEAPAWGTTVRPAISKGDIEDYLEKKLQADQIVFMWDAEKRLLTLGFRYQGSPIVLRYKPLEPRDPQNLHPWSTGYDTTIEKNREKAVWQMYRRILSHVKILVDLVLDGNEETLIPYRPILGNSGPTLQTVGMQGLNELLVNRENLALPAPGGKDA